VRDRDQMQEDDLTKEIKSEGHGGLVNTCQSKAKGLSVMPPPLEKQNWPGVVACLSSQH
jgi:hypothetical protein